MKNGVLPPQLKKRKMKNLIVTALLMIGMTTFAQEAKGLEVRKQRTEKMTPEQRNAAQLKRMTAQLNLTSSQQSEIAKILAERSEKKAALKAERKASKETSQPHDAAQKTERKQQMIAARKANQAQFQKILTADQYEKWQQINAERKTKMKSRKEMKSKKIAKDQENKK